MSSIHCTTCHTHIARPPDEDTFMAFLYDKMPYMLCECGYGVNEPTAAEIRDDFLAWQRERRHRTEKSKFESAKRGR